MIKKWKEKYKKKSIQGVILSTFSGVFFASFVILAIIFNCYGKNILKNFIKEKNEQQIEVLAEGVEREFRQTIDFLDTVHYKIIKKESVQSKDFLKMMNFICEENKTLIENLMIFEESGNVLYENYQEEPLELTSKQKKEMFSQGCSDVGKTWFEQIPQRKDLLVYRIVEVKQEDTIKSAVLAGMLRYEKIVSGFQAHEAKEKSYFYIKTQQGQLFYHPKMLQMEHKIYQEHLGMEDRKEDGVWEKKWNHEKYLVHQYTIGYTGWKIIGVASLDKILYENYPIGFLIWSMFLIVGIVAVGINHYIVKKITGPIEKLSQQVEGFGNQEIGSRMEVEIEGTYEIRKLSERFNEMQKRIQKLMKREVQKEQEYWRMQMRLLQSQINPHFLYNTLDSIIWMIQSKRYEGAAKMVSALAGFFRISLNKGEDFITVGKEIEHVKNYMEIQGIRFEDKFSFCIQCEESLKKYMCPKLIIQPLAENAVYHGMEGMYADGEIKIDAYEQEDKIFIDVCDNGEGMSEEQIQHMMHGHVISSHRGSGIGVRNVDERLKYCFGASYGIRVMSEIDEGTMVRICIPKVEDLNAYWKKEKNFSGNISNAYNGSGDFSVGTEESKDNHNFSGFTGKISGNSEGMGGRNESL